MICDCRDFAGSMTHNWFDMRRMGGFQVRRSSSQANAPAPVSTVGREAAALSATRTYLLVHMRASTLRASSTSANKAYQDEIAGVAILYRRTVYYWMHIHRKRQARRRAGSLDVWSLVQPASCFFSSPPGTYPITELPVIEL